MPSYLVTAFGGACLTSLPFATIISRWFTQQRGIALGLMGTGVFLGGMYAPPLVTSIITTVGWRWAYVTLGLIIWVVAIPLSSFLLIDTPQQKGLQPFGEHEGKRDVTPGSHPSHPPHGPSLTLAEARKTDRLLVYGGQLCTAECRLTRLHYPFRPAADGPGALATASSLRVDAAPAMGVLGKSYCRLSR